MKLHIDIDCFFVSAQRINNPQLEGKPIAVGGRSNLSIFDKQNSLKYLSNIGGAFTSAILTQKEQYKGDDFFIDQDGRKRGIITTSSYEARKYGVKTAMSVDEATRLCPELLVLAPNYPLYHKLSYELKVYLQSKIPSIEQFSIDEFFGDLSGWIEEKDVEKFASSLQNDIKKLFKIPVSIGVAHSKWIAKLATEFAKPYGVKYIPKEQLESFIENIPISKFPGVGKKYEEKLRGYGIQTLGEVKKNKELFYRWHEPGRKLYHRICGDDGEGISVQTKRKSLGVGRSFDPVFCRDEIKRRIVILCRHLSFLAYKEGYNPLKFSLNIKYQYGEKSKGFVNSNRIFHENYLKNSMLKLFNTLDKHPSHAIVQLQITLSDLQEQCHKTFDLFHFENDQKQKMLMDSLHKLRQKYGVDILKTGNEL